MMEIFKTKNEIEREKRHKSILMIWENECKDANTTNARKIKFIAKQMNMSDMGVYQILKKYKKI